MGKEPIGEYLNKAIKRAKVKKLNIVLEMDINATTLSRMLSGETVPSKPTLQAIVRAVNKLTTVAPIDEAEALEVAGYEPDEESPIVVQIADGIRASFNKKDYTPEEIENISHAFEIALAVVKLKVNQESQKYTVK